ncbi:DegV family protein [Weissella oryzae SG25]|uniref:DegV family protein n=1 Tax=Weissella oryzae (strain DSM 25784 / JCM 18191 / LMG 30913 / SG25) TaxID=1329250 RepID=A0A069CSY1_WEIOS|nr:DegV family protein [Weissella oryzae]GAK30323.1 DegV family protein [Weissella oryzae SG25]
MKIAIVTDSTAYLTAEEVTENNIKVVSIPFILDGEVFQEGRSISNADFYERLLNSDSFPSTSQPSIGETTALYEQIRDEGYDTIIAIHLASTISGYVQNVASLSNAIDGLQVYAYDSKITVRLMGSLVIKAAQMAAAGATVEEILATLDKLRASMDEYFIVDDLQNLVRGGRLSNASAVIGSLLKVKPILTFDEKSDYIVPFEKVRSMKKAVGRVEELFAAGRAKADYPLQATVYHTYAPEAGREWQNKIQAANPDMKIDFAEIGPVVGTHLGVGALALAWMRDINSL